MKNQVLRSLTVYILIIFASALLRAQVAVPIFSPPAGTYTSAQTVTITSSTGGASIAYTTDGSTPAESGGTVTHGVLLANGGTVSISASVTLSAMAFETGLADSPVDSAAYVILPIAAAPTFSPPGGSYATAQTVTISITTHGAAIAYTTDGSTPTESGGVVTNGTLLNNHGSVSVGSSVVLNAITFGSHVADSSVSKAVYVIAGQLPQVTTPVLSPPSSDGYAPLSVTITTTTPGATIRYTTDYSQPTETSGIIYNGTSVILNQPVALKAVAYETGYADSNVAIGSYQLMQPEPGQPPIFSPSPGTYTSAQTVSMSVSGGIGSIAYTTDGSAPTEVDGSVTHGTLYSGPITIASTTTITAITFGAPGFTDSSPFPATYTIDPPPPVPTTLPISGSQGYQHAGSISDQRD